MRTIATIGYEGAAVKSVLDALQKEGVDLLVDVRAVASSRSPGFSKGRLAASLQEAGIEYLHLRGLGTPAEGRAAIRGRRYEEFRRIYGEHLATPEAQGELEILADRVASGRRACLLCLEADPTNCHRTVVAETLASRMPLRIRHLHPEAPSGPQGGRNEGEKGRGVG